MLSIAKAANKARTGKSAQTRKKHNEHICMAKKRLIKFN